MPRSSAPQSSASPMLYGAAGAAAGAGAVHVANRIDSAYKMGAWGLGIGVVLAALSVVSSSDLNACQTTATNIAANYQALKISDPTTASLTSLSNDVQNLRALGGQMANNQAQIAYSANWFAFTPPVQQNFPVQSGSITATAAATQSTNSTSIVVLGLVILVALFAIVM